MRKTICLVVMAMLLAAGGAASAQPFPTQTVRLVTVLSPGTDTYIRVLADRLAAIWGKPVLVENRPGSAGVTAVQAVTSAQPDGHTLLVYGPAFLISKAVQPDLAMDPITQLAPVVKVWGNGPLGLLVGAGSPAKSADDLLSRLKPGKMSYGSAGFGLIHSSVRTLEDGRVFERLVEWITPNIICVPPVRPLMEGPANGVSWIVPVDDTHMFQVLVAKANHGKPIYFPRPNNNTRVTWGEMTERERRDYPNDFEAQMGQGPVSLHSEEHLAMSDRGLMMQRRAITKAITDVQQGSTPANVEFKADEAVVKVQARNLFRTTG